MQSKSLKVIITGGGTGGHIFPAVAVAQQIREMVPEADILFVGAQGRMEMQKVPTAGFEIVGLPVAGLQRRLTAKNLVLPFKVVASLWQAVQLIRRFKPQVVAGFGGYASAPMLFAAKLCGVPYLIQEQNSYAGLTNKWLAKWAKKICVAYPGMDAYFPKEKIQFTGNPVRPVILEMDVTREEACAAFGLDASKLVVLAIGGSLGARTINESLAEGLTQLQDAGVQLLWQTGKQGIAAATTASNGFPAVAVREFILNMEVAYKAANVVISRAGALSVSELCITGVPAILVPSPNVVADHQTKNAKVLEKVGAAILIKDVDAKEQLVSATLQLLKDEAKSQQLSHQLSTLAKPTATKQIALQVLGLAGHV